MSGTRTTKCRNQKKDIIDSWKRVAGCSKCGENDPACLDLHHPDPSKKNQRLKAQQKAHKGGNVFSLSYTDLLRELDICQVICANCHRKEHAYER